MSLGCEYCTREPVLDDDGIFENYYNETELVEGGWTSLKIGVDEKGKICMRALGDDYTINYYPKYCPECGRKFDE